MKTKAKIKVYNAAYRAANKEKIKAACGICKETFSEKQPPHVDHCHISGKVRGLLCGNCNRGLGIFRDSLGILENAKEYLKENS